MMLDNQLDETFYNGRLSWRPEQQSNTIPSPSEMLKQILEFTKNHKEFDKSRVEDITEKFYESIEKEEEIGNATTETNVDTSKKKRRETENLRAAHKFLQKQISSFDENEKDKFAQLLEVGLIQDIHKELMEGLLDRSQTAPGKFSTNKRTGCMFGNTFHYPRFKTESIALAAITALVDIYNSSVSNLKKKLSADNTTEDTLTQIFRLNAKFLFTFLQLHPFADGNGRLGRLLCSYFLEMVCPFPSAIYNVYSPSDKSDYVTILVEAREGLIFNRDLENEAEAIKFVGEIFDHIDESFLTALIVESNWYTWKEFRNKSVQQSS